MSDFLNSHLAGAVIDVIQSVTILWLIAVVWWLERSRI